MNKDCHDAGLRKQHLDVTRAGIVGISYCWYGFGYCTVLMLAVLTDGRWKLAVTYCNTIICGHSGMMLYTDPRRSKPCRMTASSTAISEWQWTASVWTLCYCTRRNSRMFTPDKCLQHYLTLWLSFWTRVPDQCVSWYSSLPYTI